MVETLWTDQIEQRIPHSSRIFRLEKKVSMTIDLLFSMTFSYICNDFNSLLNISFSYSLLISNHLSNRFSYFVWMNHIKLIEYSSNSNMRKRSSIMDLITWTNKLGREERSEGYQIWEWVERELRNGKFHGMKPFQHGKWTNSIGGHLKRLIYLWQQLSSYREYPFEASTLSI